MKNTKWNRLSQKVLLNHPRLSVYEDQVELPNGHITNYIHFGANTGASMIIAKLKDGKLLLQREYSYPTDSWLYQFPGGAIEKNETPIQAADRELAEEAGLKGSLEKLGFYYPDNRRSGRKMHVFVATELSPVKAEADIEEDIESYWFTEKEIDKKIKNGEIVNPSALAGWAFYKSQK